MIDRVQMGIRMAQARAERGLTLKDVASGIGVAASTIQRYEKGQFENIKMPVIEAIADALSVNPAWLTGHTADSTVLRTEDSTDSAASKLRDADIRAAFFNGADPTLTEEEQAAMWDDVKRYINFKIFETQQKRKGNK